MAQPNRSPRRLAYALVIATLAVAFPIVVSAALAAPPAGGKQPTSASAQGQADEQSPAKACKDERAKMGASAFADRYGTNANKRNAFGKCVSQHAKQQGKGEGQKGKDDDDEDEKAKDDDQGENEQGDDSKAAKACKDERAKMGASAFADRYGTNANKRNAFGKCVSQHAKKQGAKKK